MAGLLLLGAGNAMAATVAADTETLGATATLTGRLPAAQNFTVAAAGQVKVTLTDLAAQQPFAQLKLLVSRDGSLVTSLNAAGQQTFSATPGNYQVQVIGVPASAAGSAGPDGTFQWEVRELTGNTVLKQFTDGVAALPAPPTAQSGLDTTVQFSQAGTYQVTLADRSFPAALSSISLLLSPASASGGLVTMSGPCTTACTQSVTVTAPGTYDLFVVATAAGADQAGLYSLKISGCSGSACATTQPVGLLPPAINVTLPSSDTCTLSSADFATPAALSALKLRLVQGADQLAALDVAGSSIVSSAGAAGAAQLFVFPRAGTGGMGSYGIGLAQGVASVYSDVRTLPAGFSSTVNTGGYPYLLTVPAAASYRLQLHDLNFPTPFAQLRAVVVQNGATVQTLSGSTIDSSFALAAGNAFVAVFGTPSASNANSLLGISLAPQAGGTALLDQAQGVGPQFATHTVNIATAGSYDLTVSDLGFPAAFTEMEVAVTRGSELVGQIFGGGMIRFNAQPGAYAINLLARPDAAAQYSTWGYDIIDTPQAPTVALSASPATVSPDATTTLTWSATGASSCTASGGWSGTRALSGTEVSTPLTAGTTFKLSCSGDGGTTEKSATVTVSSSSGHGSGGGGAIDLAAVLALGALLCLRQRRLQRSPQACFTFGK